MGRSDLVGSPGDLLCREGTLRHIQERESVGENRPRTSAPGAARARWVLRGDRLISTGFRSSRHHIGLLERIAVRSQNSRNASELTL